MHIPRRVDALSTLDQLDAYLDDVLRGHFRSVPQGLKALADVLVHKEHRSDLYPEIASCYLAIYKPVVKQLSQALWVTIAYVLGYFKFFSGFIVAVEYFDSHRW